MQSKHKKILSSIISFIISAAALFSITGTIGVEADSSVSDLKASEMSNAVNDSGYVLKNVNISGGGGFIPGIIYNPTEEGLVYCRTDMGGVYRRNKSTGEWIPLTDWVSNDEWNLLGGESLATDPVEPNRVYVAAGTYTNSWTNMNGYILRSDNYGETWQRTELPFKFGGNMPGRSIGERLMVDPSSNNILYFGGRGCVNSDGSVTSNGLWRSYDYGATWGKVTGLPENIGMYAEDPRYEYSASPIGVTWVVFDKSNTPEGEPTKDIYIGAADKDKENIYHSSDAGQTWEIVAGQPTGLIPHHAVLASDGMIYITYNDYAGPYQGEYGEVYKYNTQTGEWKKITPPTGYDWDGTPKYEQYYGYGGISVDAQNPNNLVVTSLQSWWPDNYIWRSTDGGETWDCIWEWGSGYMERVLKYTMDVSQAPWLLWGETVNAGAGGIISAEAAQNPAPKLGWMMGDIEINPFNSEEMLYGTGATIYGADNLSAWDSWKDYDPYNEEAELGDFVNIKMNAVGIEETAVLSLVSPPGDVELVAGVGDICGFVFEDVTENPQAMMSNPVFTSTTGIDYAELNPDIMVRVGNTDKEQWEDIKKSIAVSKDGGKTWSEVQPNVSYSFPAIKEVDSEGNAVLDDDGKQTLNIAQGGNIAVSADGSTYVWAPSDFKKVLTYINGGWEQTEGLPENSYICSDRANPSVFYAFNNGNFYMSTDKGVSFKEVQKDLSYNTAKIKAVPEEEGNVWIPAGGEGLLYTLDSGKTIKRAVGVTRCDVVGFGKAKEGSSYMSIYICGEVNGIYGVYRSDDKGVSWVRVNDDTHQYGSINYAITGDPDIYGRVYFGTNGRGVIYADLKEEAKEIITDTLGDVNCDGNIGVADLILLKKGITGNISKYLTIQGSKNADITGDGVVNVMDVINLKRYLMGGISTIK